MDLTKEEERNAPLLTWGSRPSRRLHSSLVSTCPVQRALQKGNPKRRRKTKRISISESLRRREGTTQSGKRTRLTLIRALSHRNLSTVRSRSTLTSVNLELHRLSSSILSFLLGESSLMSPSSSSSVVLLSELVSDLKSNRNGVSTYYPSELCSISEERRSAMGMREREGEKTED